MTRLLTTGFETGDISDIVLYNTVPSVQTSPTPRSGAYFFREAQGGGWAQFKSFTGTDVLYGGMAIQRNYTSSEYQIFQILDVGSNILLQVKYTAGNKFALYRDNTLIATGTVDVLVNAWMYLEFYMLCAEAGAFVLKVNGVIDINFSGDTRPGAVSDAVAVRLYGSPGNNLYTYFDDVVLNDDAGGVNDTYPGAIKLEVIRPTAAGDSTDLSRGGADSGANWSQVEEVPASASDYVYDTVAEEYDLYNCGTITLPSGYSVKNVVVVAQALLDSGSGNIALMVKSGATEDEGASQALGISAKNYEEVYSVNPDDSAAWEQADIDSLQIGVKVK